MMLRTRGLISAGILLALTACKAEAPPPPPPPEVKVAEVLQRDVPIYIEAVGQTRGNTEIEIRARVGGYLETVDFQEGSRVRKGQQLYLIDPRPFESELAQARGSLAEAEAQLAKARQDVVRYEPLVAKNAISREEYETAVAAEQAMKAAVEAAKAAVESARLNLDYTRVTCPADGLIGKTEVFAGTFVPQNTLLARVSRTDPIHARFNLVERDYLVFARRRARMEAGADVGATDFRLILADGTVHPHEGRILFVDREVDPRTGTIMGEAAFPNPEGIVRPGQYARVRAAVEIKRGALLVAQRSVVEMQGTYSVAVVSPDGTVDMRPVTPAERIGNLWLIASGLRPGEKVVVEGLQKVRPGMKVNASTVALEEKDKAGTGESTPTVEG